MAELQQRLGFNIGAGPALDQRSLPQQTRRQARWGGAAPCRTPALITASAITLPLLHPTLFFVSHCFIQHFFFVKRLMRSARGSLGATSAESLMEDALATPMMRRHAAPEGERGATEREIVHAQDPT